MAAKTQSVSRLTQRAVGNPVGSRGTENTNTYQPGEQFRDVHAVEDWLEAEQQLLNKG